MSSIMDWYAGIDSEQIANYSSWSNIFNQYNPWMHNNILAHKWRKHKPCKHHNDSFTCMCENLLVHMQKSWNIKNVTLGALLQTNDAGVFLRTINVMSFKCFFFFFRCTVQFPQVHTVVSQNNCRCVVHHIIWKWSIILFLNSICLVLYCII